MGPLVIPAVSAALGVLGGLFNHKAKNDAARNQYNAALPGMQRNAAAQSAHGGLGAGLARAYGFMGVASPESWQKITTPQQIPAFKGEGIAGMIGNTLNSVASAGVEHEDFWDFLKKYGAKPGLPGALPGAAGDKGGGMRMAGPMDEIYT